MQEGHRNFLVSVRLFKAINQLNTMKDEEDVERDDAQINGRTEGPFGSDDTDADQVVRDNKNRPEVEDSANGLDSVQERGGQDGRNNRGFGGIDMDSRNGVLRMGDMDESTMQVTEEGANNAAGDKTLTKTSVVDISSETAVRSSSINDWSTLNKRVPNAQQEANEEDNADEEETSTDDDQTAREEDVAETGTDLNNQPTY
jgi:glutamate synthase domain-containing protein 1